MQETAIDKKPTKSSAPSCCSPRKTSPVLWVLSTLIVFILGGYLALKLTDPFDLSWTVFWALFPLVVAIAIGVRLYFRYRTAEVMPVAIREYSNEEYPEDPADRSVHFGQYDGRRLVLVQKENAHFDLIFEPKQPHIATVAFRNLDVSLMTPSLPAWTKQEDGLRRIALTDRQWNRQQVSFARSSPHLEILGGDGFEEGHIYSAELAKNCLNAGLWEVLLFAKEGNTKALYYQGWFTFPMGHYKDVFERNTGLPYRSHWYYLEHWFDPAGTWVPMAKLRRVIAEREVPARFDSSENVLAAGEQLRKRRTTLAQNVVRWGDFYDGREVRFAAFRRPGRYRVDKPWKNQYWRMDRFEKAILREINTLASEKPLQELELVFTSKKQEGLCRFIVSGFDLAGLPQLPMEAYPNGFYMPMGIGVPPFFQGYDELTQKPPYTSPYVSVLLDGQEKWINHHSFAIDGSVMHLDEMDPNVLHVYLLSYERHSLIAHLVVAMRESLKG